MAAIHTNVLLGWTLSTATVSYVVIPSGLAQQPGALAVPSILPLPSASGHVRLRVARHGEYPSSRQLTFAIILGFFRRGLLE